MRILNWLCDEHAVRQRTLSAATTVTSSARCLRLRPKQWTGPEEPLVLPEANASSLFAHGERWTTSPAEIPIALLQSLHHVEKNFRATHYSWTPSGSRVFRDR